MINNQITIMDLLLRSREKLLFLAVTSQLGELTVEEKQGVENIIIDICNELEAVITLINTRKD